MSKSNTQNSLTEWYGDVDSLLAEMKRRAGVSTDVELSEFMGITQGAIANWRRRSSVPESALLSFERQLASDGDFPHSRAMFARALAMRLAEFDYAAIKARGGMASRTLVYGIHAAQLDIVADECFHQLELLEDQMGISPDAAAAHLMDDDNFFAQLSAWAKELPVVQVLSRQALSSMMVVRRPRTRRADIHRNAAKD